MDILEVGCGARIWLTGLIWLRIVIAVVNLRDS
jgi:hypothetical protein